MKINIEYLKEQFKNIIQQANLKITLEDEYGAVFQNDKIRLSFSTDRWEDGVSLSLTDKIRNEFYHPWDLEEKKGFQKSGLSFLSPAESSHFKSLPGDDGIIYVFRILLERYCQKELLGDFSEIMPGTKRMG
jgi:hypothetical protein